MVLCGFINEDTAEDLEWCAHKIAAMRIFDDKNGVMNRSVVEAGGDILVISQFTLLASTRKGNRPSYVNAARPEISKPLYERFLELLSDVIGKPVMHGIFGVDMQVELVNDGPVTIILDTKEKI